ERVERGGGVTGLGLGPPGDFPFPQRPTLRSPSPPPSPRRRRCCSISRGAYVAGGRVRQWRRCPTPGRGGDVVALAVGCPGAVGARVVEDEAGRAGQHVGLAVHAVHELVAHLRVRVPEDAVGARAAGAGLRLLCNRDRHRRNHLHATDWRLIIRQWKAPASPHPPPLLFLARGGRRRNRGRRRLPVHWRGMAPPRRQLHSPVASGRFTFSDSDLETFAKNLGRLVRGASSDCFPLFLRREKPALKVSARRGRACLRCGG
ncbi:Protein of unknown function, partial [Gryllus bimaculatus]